MYKVVPILVEALNKSFLEAALGVCLCLEIVVIETENSPIFM